MCSVCCRFSVEDYEQSQCLMGNVDGLGELLKCSTQHFTYEFEHNNLNDLFSSFL